jgi:hypothetical protein
LRPFAARRDPDFYSVELDRAQYANCTEGRTLGGLGLRNVRHTRADVIGLRHAVPSNTMAALSVVSTYQLPARELVVGRSEVGPDGAIGVQPIRLPASALGTSIKVPGVPL